MSIILTARLLMGTTPQKNQEAAIADIHKDSTPSPNAETKTETHRPKAYSRSGMNSVAPGVSADTVRYYDEQSGAAFSTDLRTGKTTTLSENHLFGFVRTLWVPKRDLVVSLFETKGTREYRSYDYQTGAVATVASGADALALSPDSRMAAYTTVVQDATLVSLVNLDGTGSRSLLKTRIPSPTIAWPQPDILLLMFHRPDRVGSDMVTISTAGIFSVFMSNRENLEYVLSPDGRRILFSYFSASQGIRLWYRDLGASTEYPLDIHTSARKCAWHVENTRITCGVPANAELSRDIPSEMMATSDDIISVDIETGEQTKIFGSEPKTPLGIMDPVITPSGKYLSFVNLFDRRLYSIEL